MSACTNHRIDATLCFDAQRLENVFAECFGSEFNTVLRGGFEEPFYQPPAQSAAPAVICYRADYFASALHEIAHWCIAGSARRQCSDYGYWYSPEGRTINQQREFERAEVNPQAIEWFFSLACAYEFKISPDNFDPITGESVDSSSFEKAVLERAQLLTECGLPTRAQCYFDALVCEFNTRDTSGNPLSISTLEFNGSEPLR